MFALPVQPERRARALAALLSLAVMVAPLGAQSDAPIVRFMKSGPRTAPIWIDAEAATRADGAFKSEYFEEGELDRSGPSPEIDPSSGECTSFVGEPSLHSHPGRSSANLEDLVRFSDAIFTVIVETVHPGLFEGIGYSRLRVKVVDVIRGSGEISATELDVLYPYANFIAGGRRFCTDSALRYRPRPGDRILLFLYGPAVDPHGTLVAPQSDEMAIESSTGKLLFGENLNRTPWMSAAHLDDLATYVRSRAGERP